LAQWWESQPRRFLAEQCYNQSLSVSARETGWRGMITLFAKGLAQAVFVHAVRRGDLAATDTEKSGNSWNQ